MGIFDKRQYATAYRAIELVWALIKGNVGRQYTKETTLAQVYDRLMTEFKKLEEGGHATLAGMIEKCARLTADLYQESQENDEEDEYDGSEGEDDNGSEQYNDDFESEEEGIQGILEDEIAVEIAEV